MLAVSCTTGNSSPIAIIKTSAITEYQTTKSATTMVTKTSTAAVNNSTPTSSDQEIPLQGQPLTIDSNRMDFIDNYVEKTPASVTTSVSILVNYLITPAQNDIERARAIYSWVAHNISYDYNAYLTHSYGDTSASGVLQSRSSVCEGYSSLFEALAKDAGLDVVTIDGWGKGIGYAVGDQISGSTNHAWNAVKINGSWYLIDSTWGAGYIDQSHFVQEFCDGYFLTPPETFIIDHFPKTSSWQLLKQPMSQSEFAQLPLTYSGFFQYRLGFTGTYQPVTDANGEISVSLAAPDDVVLIARLYQGTLEMAQTCTFTQRVEQRYQIKAVVPNAGNYVLRVYAKNRSDTGNYWGAIDFSILANAASAYSRGFPVTFGVFSIGNVTLYSPMIVNLVPGTIQNFDLVVPGTDDVEVVIGNLWQKLSENNSRFSGQINVTVGTIHVCAKYPGNQNFSVLLEYSSP
jgi:transglutaminase/protease-like cytokinesis protein 3